MSEIEHFNGLTPAQAERLSLLMEEMGEAIATIGKIQRHGYESKNPDDPLHVSNRRDLEEECGHVVFAIGQLCNAGDLSSDSIESSEAKKRSKVQKWLHHHKVKP